MADNCYFGDSNKREGDSSAFGGNNFANAYSAPAGFGGYSAPAGNPASDFAMLEDDDAQLPY